MALYDEAITARKVGKPEYTARCESIALEIFPVEQQVLSPVSQFINSSWDGNLKFYPLTQALLLGWRNLSVVSHSSNFLLSTPAQMFILITIHTVGP